MAENKGSVVARVEKLALPIAQQLGLKIWDIEFVKEGASWYLRFFIDKPNGISISDCENFSHAIDGPIDEADPIEQNYYLEVSSPGIERELKTDSHYEEMTGCLIKLQLIRPDSTGRRQLEGKLIAYKAGVITLETPAGEILVKKAETSHVRLADTNF